MSATNRRKFLENLVECVRCAAQVPGVAVLALDVRTDLLVECHGVCELPVYSAHHRTDRLEA